MSQYRVVAGDTPESLAARHHLPWTVIWGNPTNAELQRTRGGPGGHPEPGDTLFIPATQTVTAAPGNNAAQAPRDREYYLSRSFNNAFGGGRQADPDGFRRREDADWNPELGWGHNRDRISRLYDYYQRVYQLRPSIFLWAGLGRMAGGAVFGGLDLFHSMNGGSEDVIRTMRIMVAIGKAIFLDLAWQHEAYVDDPQRAIDLAAAYDLDQRSDPRYSYAAAWTAIRASENAGTVDASMDVDDATIAAARERISRANESLLHNEQWRIIQPYYDRILHDSGMRRATGMTSAFTNNIHPYHRPFLEFRSNGSVFVADDRWAWISGQFHMWDDWAAIPQDERQRLARMSLDDSFHQRWGTILTSGPGVPPGAYTSEGQ